MNIFKQDEIYYYNKRINILGKLFSIRKLSILTVLTISLSQIIVSYGVLGLHQEILLVNDKLILSYTITIILYLAILLLFHDYRKLSVVLLIILFFLDFFKVIYFQLDWYSIYKPLIHLWLIFTIINLEKDILKGNKVP